jgi:hypothetical protein
LQPAGKLGRIGRQREGRWIRATRTPADEPGALAVGLAEREVNKVKRDDGPVAAELERQWDVALSEFLTAEVPPPPNPA